MLDLSKHINKAQWVKGEFDDKVEAGFSASATVAAESAAGAAEST